jgi:hypothetical protein
MVFEPKYAEALLMIIVLHVFIYWTLVRLILVTFQYNTGSSNWTIDDPRVFRLFPDTGTRSSPVSSIAFKFIRGPTSKNGDKEASLLVKMVMRNFAGELSEATFTYNSSIQPTLEQDDGFVIPRPSSHGRHALSSAIVDEEDDLDDFLVADDSEYPGPGALQMDYISRKTERPTKDLSWMFENPARTLLDLETSLTTAEEALQGNHDSSYARTIREILPAFKVEDVDEATSSLEAWSNRLAGPANAKDVSLSKIRRNVKGIADCYGFLEQGFVEAISEKAADRIRVNTERLSRQVAVDQALSEISVLRPQAPSAQLLDEDMEPVRDGNIGKGSPDSAFAGLKKYTSFSPPTTEQRTVTGVSEILAHLPAGIGADPEQYSYGDVELDLARTKLQAQELDPAARRRAGRLEAARAKRLARVQAAGKMAMSQATPLHMRSSSPITGERAMTQQEPGTFGARPKSRKLKQRQDGF